MFDGWMVGVLLMVAGFLSLFVEQWRHGNRLDRLQNHLDDLEGDYAREQMFLRNSLTNTEQRIDALVSREQERNVQLLRLVMVVEQLVNNKPNLSASAIYGNNPGKGK